MAQSICRRVHNGTSQVRLKSFFFTSFACQVQNLLVQVSVYPEPLGDQGIQQWAHSGNQPCRPGTERDAQSAHHCES